ncbi:MAG: hypothetical protein FWG48_04945 [Oscillospiraceae bacterium]|nr:hypothetical protein [Oscillospiraceae bacterium]
MAKSKKNRTAILRPIIAAAVTLVLAGVVIIGTGSTAQALEDRNTCENEFSNESIKPTVPPTTPPPTTPPPTTPPPTTPPPSETPTEETTPTQTPEETQTPPVESPETEAPPTQTETPQETHPEETPEEEPPPEETTQVPPEETEDPLFGIDDPNIPGAGRESNGNGGPQGSGSIPKTGDETDPRLWLAILAAGAIVLRYVLFTRTKKE